MIEYDEQRVALGFAVACLQKGLESCTTNPDPDQSNGDFN